LIGGTRHLSAECCQCADGRRVWTRVEAPSSHARCDRDELAHRAGVIAAHRRHGGGCPLGSVVAFIDGSTTRMLICRPDTKVLRVRVYDAVSSRVAACARCVARAFDSQNVACSGHKKVRRIVWPPAACQAVIAPDGRKPMMAEASIAPRAYEPAFTGRRARTGPPFILKASRNVVR
jgi:hypothetical protein